MLILHLSTGLANMIYEYCAAYALAEELGIEMCVDITNFVLRGEQYTLDLLAVPVARKVYALGLDPEHLAQGDPLSVAPELRKDAITLVQPGVYEGPETENIIYYHSLSEAKKIKEIAGNRNIILNGYFFDKKYYMPYWDYIRKFLHIKEETSETMAFRKIARGKTTVGIHIRRGDFQVADFSVPIEREYWKAAVVFMRKHLKNPIFFVVSDDIDYAQSVLGNDSAIYYVKFMGMQEADLYEFTCLTRCDHRILTVQSTFSRLADELHGGTRYVIWKGTDPAHEAFAKEKAEREIHLRATGMRRILLYPEEISELATQYQADGLVVVNRWKLGDDTCKLQSAGYTIERIADVSLMGGSLKISERERLLYKKMEADYQMRNYKMVYGDAKRIYTKFARNLHFQRMLRDSLRACGYEQEAQVEEVRDKTEDGMKCKFFLAPYLDLNYSTLCTGLAELGSILFHMGHSVTYLFHTCDDGEAWYIRNNCNYVDRYGIEKGGQQVLLSDIVRDHESLSAAIKYLTRDESYRYVLISRSPSCLAACMDIDNITTVFPDFSDGRDLESTYANEHMINEHLELLYGQADIILSHIHQSINTYDWVDKGDFAHVGTLRVGQDASNIGVHFKPMFMGMAFALQDVLEKIADGGEHFRETLQ